MEINSHFIAAAKPRKSIDISRCPAGFNISVNGQAIQFERSADVRPFVSRLSTLLKKPVVKY